MFRDIINGHYIEIQNRIRSNAVNCHCVCSRHCIMTFPSWCVTTDERLILAIDNGNQSS